jgi:DNA-3-methyladenine glycosylase
LGFTHAPRRAAPGGARRSARGGALPQEFYLRPADRVARELLGCRLVSIAGGVRCAAEIVETEAYVGPDDEASHAHRRFGRTPRNDVMFGAPGIAYVYLIYGLHSCLNAVTGPEGFPAAVLLRAARPLEGIGAMRERRVGRTDRDLLRGPGNLCSALGVDRSLNGHALSAPPLWIEPGPPVPDAAVAIGPRIGIRRASDLPLRYRIAGSPWVSR